jgi:hypothetical protein
MRPGENRMIRTGDIEARLRSSCAFRPWLCSLPEPCRHVPVLRPEPLRENQVNRRQNTCRLVLSEARLHSCNMAADRRTYEISRCPPCLINAATVLDPLKSRKQVVETVPPVRRYYDQNPCHVFPDELRSGRSRVSRRQEKQGRGSTLVGRLHRGTQSPSSWPVGVSR